MLVLECALTLGVISIVYGLLWRWAVGFPLSILLSPLPPPAFKAFLVVSRACGFYLLVALTAIAVLFYARGEPTAMRFGLAVLGGLVVYILVAKTAYDARKEASRSHDWDSARLLQWDGLFIIASVALYVVSIFIPRLIVNHVTRAVWIAVMWVYDLPVVHWILNILGGLFVLRVAWMAIVFSVIAFGSLREKLTKVPSGGEH